jgi:DNA-binding NarL/FixJ family response regulator
MERASATSDYDVSVALQLPDGRRRPRSRAPSSRSTGGCSGDLTVLNGGGGDAIGVLVAASVGFIRAGLTALLETQVDIEVVGEAQCGAEAVALAAERRPDVLLMGKHVTGLGALDATRQICADPSLGDVRVVILVADERDEDLLALLRAGARGIVHMDAAPEELLRAMRAVAEGGAHLPPHAAQRLLEELAAARDPANPDLERFAELTARECEIVRLVAHGLTNDEIAAQLVISPATAKTHVSRAMLKLGTRDRAKLVALAYQSGFVTYNPANVVPRDHVGGRSAGGQSAALQTTGRRARVSPLPAFTDAVRAAVVRLEPAGARRATSAPAPARTRAETGSTAS